MDVLVEGASKRDETMIAGKSPKNQTVHARIPRNCDLSALTGQIVRVNIEEARTWYLTGTMLEGKDGAYAAR